MTRRTFDILTPLVVVVPAGVGRRFPRWVTPRWASPQLATRNHLLVERASVINYDRRGRGQSGDTTPYAVEREVEDINALVKEAGGSAFLFGSSSGAALALEAAALGAGVERLAPFEPPFVVQVKDPRPPADFAARIDDLIAADRRAMAVTYFMTKGIGMPAAFVWLMRLMPRTWRSLKSMAPHDPLRRRGHGGHAGRQALAVRAVGFRQGAHPGHGRRQEPAAPAPCGGGSGRDPPQRPAPDHGKSEPRRGSHGPPEARARTA